MIELVGCVIVCLLSGALRGGTRSRHSVGFGMFQTGFRACVSSNETCQPNAWPNVRGRGQKVAPAGNVSGGGSLDCLLFVVCCLLSVESIVCYLLLPGVITLHQSL